jgi:predicted ATPase
MIESLRLHNFKCFADRSLPLEDLTLLTGLNGAGKSSVLQALLVLRQSFQQGVLKQGRLALNGDLVQIGTARDALYGYAEDDQIAVELVTRGGGASSFVFKYDKDTDVLAGGDTQTLDSLPVADDMSTDSEGTAAFPSVPLAFWVHSPFSDSFQYLCAERVGPRTSFATSDFLVRERRQLGVRGELTAHFLATFGKDRVPPGPLLRADAASPDLRDQVEAWLDLISPGTRIQVTSHPSMDAVQLGYQFVSGREMTDVYRPTNVGFGLTYTLPVIVAVLSAAPGALLLLENPESHLHPRGQARMGEMLALAASGGIQVIVETHSDHVLNGVRLAVHKGDLDPAKVALHFFQRQVEHGEGGDRPLHSVISPRIDRNGRIDKRPEGFFDEWDKSLRQLLKPAKRQAPGGALAKRQAAGGISR